MFSRKTNEVTLPFGAYAETKQPKRSGSIIGNFELFVLSIGLAMDAFAVSVLKGLSAKRIRLSHMLLCGLYFGAFQALMPLIGHLLGIRFQSMIAHIDHWIALLLLGYIGFNMIRQSRCGQDVQIDASFAFLPMLLLCIATSIDALAVGISFACLGVKIVPAAAMIGSVTFLISAAGVCAGSLFGPVWKNRAELCGGLILILIGLKVAVSHIFAG